MQFKERSTRMNSARLWKQQRDKGVIKRNRICQGNRGDRRRVIRELDERSGRWLLPWCSGVLMDY